MDWSDFQETEAPFIKQSKFPPEMDNAIARIGFVY